jgi:hypothetical protein
MMYSSSQMAQRCRIPARGRVSVRAPNRQVTVSTHAVAAPANMAEAVKSKVSNKDLIQTTYCIANEWGKQMSDGDTYQVRSQSPVDLAYVTLQGPGVCCTRSGAAPCTATPS